MLEFVSEKEESWKSLPERLEAGTPNLAAVFAFGEVLKYLNTLRIEDLWEQEKVLSKYLWVELSKIDFLPRRSSFDL